MRDEHEMNSHRIETYIVERVAADFLAESRSSWHLWSCELPGKINFYRISIVDTPEEAIEQIRHSADIGFDPRIVVKSVDSPLIAAVIGKDIPDAGIVVLDSDPGGVVDLLRHPDAWMMDTWESLCIDSAIWEQFRSGREDQRLDVQPEDPAIQEAVAAAFPRFVHDLPEPDRMRLTPRGEQLEEIVDRDGFLSRLVNAFRHEGLERRHAEYHAMLRDWRGWLRALGAQGLGHLGAPLSDLATLEKLVRALDDSEAEVRIEAASALGNMKAAAATDHILAALEKQTADSDTSVSEAAANAIEKLRACKKPHKETAPKGMETMPQWVGNELADRFSHALSATKDLIALFRTTPQDTVFDGGFQTTFKEPLRIEVASADGRLSGELSREEDGRMLLLWVFGEDVSLAGKAADLAMFRADGTLLIEPITCSLKLSNTGKGVVGDKKVDLGDVEGKPAKFDLRVRD